mmetsp:Transcript_4564/g.17250  ORF Transcript_4564/g.17250 Transcript_4564/m.17250 type:complete len:246 (+) Transcript_4564:425-1162(+)
MRHACIVRLPSSAGDWLMEGILRPRPRQKAALLSWASAISRICHCTTQNVFSNCIMNHRHCALYIYIVVSPSVKEEEPLASLVCNLPSKLSLIRLIILSKHWMGCRIKILRAFVLRAPRLSVFGIDSGTTWQWRLHLWSTTCGNVNSILMQSFGELRCCPFPPLLLFPLLFPSWCSSWACSLISLATHELRMPESLVFRSQFVLLCSQCLQCLHMLLVLLPFPFGSAPISRSICSPRSISPPSLL